MLMRSTGLGKAELIGEVTGVKAQGDYLVMEMNTTEPVRWKIRVAVSRKDIGMLLKMMLKIPLVVFLVSVKGWFRTAAHPGDY